MDGYTGAVGLCWGLDMPLLPDAETSPTSGAELPSPAAAAAFQVLGTTLTTAMRSGEPTLSDNFREDLLDSDVELDPDEHGTSQAPIVPARDRNLATLLSYTNPPTDLAVDIAQAHLTPLLQTNDEDDLDAASSLVSNYSEMLGHNPDASAVWLASDVDTPSTDDDVEGQTNLELALVRETDEDLDGGRALAEVVENGLTNDNSEYSARNPDTGERTTIGERLMDRSIGIVADMDELENEHMYDALATGVDEHMGLIDERINEGRDVAIDSDATDRGTETYEFFQAMMHDEDAAGSVAASAEEYAIEQIRDPDFPPHDPVHSDGMDPRNERLRQLGAIQGTILAAEGEVLIDSTQDYIEVQQQRASAVNFGVGLVPYLAEAGSAAESALGVIANANDLAEVGGGSLGDVTFPSDLDDLRDAFSEQQAREAAMATDTAVLVAIAENPDHGFPPVNEMTDAEREEFLQWVVENFDPDDQANLHLGVLTTANHLMGTE